MASAPFVWGPAQGVPIWMPYSPYMQSPLASPYASPYASPMAAPPALYAPSPYYPAPSLWPGTPFASPYAPLSPVAPPNTLGLATPYTPPTGPSPSGGQTSSLPPTPPVSAPPTPPPQVVHVAPWLMYNPLDPRPAIQWDVSADPSTAKQWSAKLWKRVPLAPQFDERATYPGAADKLLIVVDGVPAVGEAYGAIEVPGADPSVGDVLRAVHAFFQRQMSKDEVEKAKAAREGNWERMIAAMAARCRRGPGLPEYEWSRGLRRIDLLDEKTAWGGLQVEYTADGGWQLRLMLADPPAAEGAA